ncbi:MAG TPA: TlpA disulfide reductase family protein [Gemmatimonadales bacterium]|nr:TlpA disulfide reductase family protein [Gemmatimonadales bacterium]
MRLHAIVSLLLLGAVACEAAQNPVRVGDIAPDARVLDLATGDTISLTARYGGGVTLVNIWATWCLPCKEEIPALDSLYRALGPQGLRIAAVSIDTRKSSEVRDWIAPFGVGFDVLQDPSGEIQRIYRTTGVPESFLIDKRGRIMRIVYAAAPWASVANRRIIEALLAANPEQGE